MKTHKKSRPSRSASKKIRYGVLGLGHIAQTAMIPAFKHATKNSELTALISEDPKKLKVLSKKYKIKNTFKESDFDEAISSRCMDALYIATPNTDHTRYVIKALKAGLHVLCEKPLAANLNDCLLIQAVMQKHPDSKLMVGYRLHFDPANLTAIQEASRKSFGKSKCFSSVFSYQVKDKNNIRLKEQKGGGPMLDIGIYCINAARYMFRAEPTEVFAMSARPENDERFLEVDEMISVTMRFPEGRLAQFTCSFGMYDSSDFSFTGEKGRLYLENAYEYVEDMELCVETESSERIEHFKKHDQFAPELLYFSDCILKDKTPEPSVKEAISDLKIIEAVRKSIKTGKRIFLENDSVRDYPLPSMKIKKPGFARSPQPVHATSPSK